MDEVNKEYEKPGSIFAARQSAKMFESMSFADAYTREAVDHLENVLEVCDALAAALNNWRLAAPASVAQSYSGARLLEVTRRAYGEYVNKSRAGMEPLAQGPIMPTMFVGVFVAGGTVQEFIGAKTREETIFLMGEAMARFASSGLPGKLNACQIWELDDIGNRRLAYDFLLGGQTDVR